MLTERAIVGALCRRDPAVFAMGLTAARLLGFPLPGIHSAQVTAPPQQGRRVDGRTGARPGGDVVDRRIHLGTTGARRRNSALLRWSLVDAEAIILPGEDAVRTTSRLRTLIDLANVLDRDALVVIGDHLVRRPRPRYEGREAPYVTVDELIETAATYRGRGARRLRDAVDLVRMSSDSPPETSLRLAMVRSGLPEPLANGRLQEQRADGAVLHLGEPDLQWPQYRVALEHEGPAHLDSEQLVQDIARADRRRRAGWIEVRTTYADLPYGCRAAVEKVRAALMEQGWRPQ